MLPMVFEMPLQGLLLKGDGGRDNISPGNPYWAPEEENHERPERYFKGGYCPIALYQLLHERYKIVYKLGAGRFATVWLAWDRDEERHVALKILTADQFAESSELAMLRRVAEQSKHTSPSESSYVINVQDAFDLTSVNGDHRVLVMPITRPIMSLRNSKVPFRSVVKSLVKALDEIHSAGIVHGGKYKYHGSK